MASSFNATEYAHLRATVAGLQQQLADTTSTIDTMWTLTVCALIFIMQSGFAFLEAGTVQDKNVRTIIMKNMVDFAISSVMFWLLGFPLAHSGNSGFIGGTEGWFISGLEEMAHFWFTLLFCSTTTTIVSGAVASRITFYAYLLVAALLAGVVHPIVAHWVWASNGVFGTGSWKVIDFAGGIPVHMVGGMAALLGAMMVGAREGRFKVDANGKVQEGNLKQHSVVLAASGTFLLWFGWYGFNPGSTEIASKGRIFVSAHAAVTTSLAAGAAVVMAVVISTFVDGVHNLWQIMNGLLAGLVAITPACATVEPWSALLIGFLSSLVVRAASKLVFMYKIDDVVDAWSVHYACGLLGSLCAALMSTQDLIDRLYGPNVIDYKPLTQLLIHLVAAVVTTGFVSIVIVLLFGAMKLCKCLRVSREDEITGLDFKYHANYKMTTFAERIVEARRNEEAQKKMTEIVMARRRDHEESRQRARDRRKSRVRLLSRMRTSNRSPSPDMAASAAATPPPPPSPSQSVGVGAARRSVQSAAASSSTRGVATGRRGRASVARRAAATVAKDGSGGRGAGAGEGGRGDDGGGIGGEDV